MKSASRLYVEGMNCSLTVDCILTPSLKYSRAQGSPSSKCCDYKGLTGNLCKVLVFCKMKCACEMEKKKGKRLYLSAVLPYVALAGAQ